MTKKLLLGTVVVFITWSILDFVIHGFLLQSMYEATMELWRPMEEMKVTVMYAVTAVAALCFTAVYVYLVAPKSVKTGLVYGVIFGVGAGVSIGIGIYSFMPLPAALAWAWLGAYVVEAGVGGVLLGWLVKP